MRAVRVVLCSKAQVHAFCYYASAFVFGRLAQRYNTKINGKGSKSDRVSSTILFASKPKTAAAGFFLTSKSGNFDNSVFYLNLRPDLSKPPNWRTLCPFGGLPRGGATTTGVTKF